MEEYVSFHKILDLLQQFQENNPRLNSFGYGNLVDFGKNVSGTTVVYPFMFIVPLSIAYDQNTTTYQLSVIFADRLNETLDNEKDCVSDMSLCARDLLSQILRGDLFNYFETVLPANAQPFMERFNDNVAGVALDLNVQVIEDINACVQYPTPTPSQTSNLPTPTNTPSPSVTPSHTPTPSITPTLTPTPSITPSVTPSITPTMTNTPTMTQTPSGTPTMIDPNTLSALWWIDYSDPARVSLSSGNVAGVQSRTGSPSFSAVTGQEPGYFPTAYNGVSGATGTGFGVFSLSGDYNSNISSYTTFFHFSAVSADQAVVIQSDFTTDYSGNTQGYRWFSIDDYSTFFGVPVRTYTFYTGGTSTSPEPFMFYSADTWTAGATRIYMSGISAVTEIWMSGTLVGQTIQANQTIITASNPIFKVGGNGGPTFKISEAFFFDYALSDSQMGDMFTYLNNKY